MSRWIKKAAMLQMAVRSEEVQLASEYGAAEVKRSISTLDTISWR